VKAAEMVKRALRMKAIVFMFVVVVDVEDIFLLYCLEVSFYSHLPKAFVLC